jgi:hypothetical protein
MRADDGGGDDDDDDDDGTALVGVRAASTKDDSRCASWRGVGLRDAAADAADAAATDAAADAFLGASARRAVWSQCRSALAAATNL